MLLKFPSKRTHYEVAPRPEPEHQITPKSWQDKEHRAIFVFDQCPFCLEVGKLTLDEGAAFPAMMCERAGQRFLVRFEPPALLGG